MPTRVVKGGQLGAVGFVGAYSALSAAAVPPQEADAARQQPTSIIPAPSSFIRIWGLAAEKRKRSADHVVADGARAVARLSQARYFLGMARPLEMVNILRAVSGHAQGHGGGGCRHDENFFPVHDF